MSEGLITRKILEDTANAIREKIGSEESIKPSQFPEKIASIQGGDSFWANYLANIENASSLRYFFAGVGWNDNTFNPPSQIVLPTGANARYLFYYSGVTEITDDKIRFSATGDWRNVFDECRNLRRIEFWVGSTVFTATTFANCTALEDFEPLNTINVNGLNLSDCENLTLQSCKNIFNKLSTSGSGKSVVLPTHTQALIEADTEASALLTQVRGYGWSIGW